MRLTSYKKLSEEDKNFLISAKKTAERSVTLKGHKIGCLIICSDGSTYLGATAARTRVVGSTCAERMALDQWYFSDAKTDPQICYLTGVLNRISWRDDFVCTPCGACLEMFLELFVERNLKSLKFVCSNWRLNKVLIADLSELFPQIGKGGWPYIKHKGIR
ncbi:MAG: cytidine deaminase [Patescibacteria group bacterium]